MGMTWNNEGFRDPGKHLFVKESVREHKLDFIALLETGRSNLRYLFLEILRMVKILRGSVYHLMVVRVVSLWGLILRRSLLIR